MTDVYMLKLDTNINDIFLVIYLDLQSTNILCFALDNIPIFLLTNYNNFKR